MGRSRYKVHEPTQPHFVTCTILHWIPIFTNQEGIQPKLIQNKQMMREKIDYIHNNPIKREYIDEASHWRYSSARIYENR